ncbi:protein PRR14L isoform 2-T2 [Rhinophrynus dorsalis]
MHSDTPDSSISSPENLLASPQTISICKTAAEYAIVPYKDIFGFLSGTKVPPTQCKVKFQDSYEEGIQNEMARSHFLDEEDPSAFTLIGCSLQQVAEDMLKPQGKDHSQKHKENNYSSPEEYMSTMHSIKQSGACQELALHLFPPPDKMSLCEIPVVTVSEGSDLSTLGGATYLGEDSRDHKPYVCPGSTDIVELLNPQHDSTLVQGNYLFSSSVEVADISLTRSDTLSNDQINESPTQPELGQTQPLKFFDEPHEGDNGKSVEGISISTLDSSRPVCVVKHRKTEEKNHRGNKEELGDSQFHIANHELMPAEQMGEVPVIPASEEIVQRCLRSDSIMKVACESSVTDGSPQVHVLSHETNSVSMTNVQSLVLCDTAIHFTSDLENNSSVRSWTDSHAGDVEVSIKRKRGCDKIQQSMQKFETRQKKPVRQKYKCISKSSKESVNHSSGCDMEITASVSTENNIKHVPEQRPKHKSLTTIKCQDAKLPKICKTHDAEPSQHTRTQPAKDSVLNCNRRSPEITMRLRPRPPKITSDTKDLQSTLSSSSHLPSNISLKKQPSKRLKCITLQEGAKATHQQTTCNSDTMMCSTSVPEDQYRFMQLKQDMAPMPLVSEATTKLMSYKLAQKSVIPYMKPTILQKYTKEQSLLHQLSSLACKLTTPFKSSSYKLKPVSRRFENPSFGGVQLKARKLLEVFSCFNMKLISPSEEICSKVVPFSPARDCLTSQQMALYPASSSRTEFFNLSDRFSLGPSLCTAFPVSSHMKEDSGQLSNFVNFTSPLYMIEKPASTTQLPQLSEWTLSLLLSPHKPAASEHIHLFTHWQPHLRALEASSSGSRHKTSSVRRGAGCAMLGLHTILALSSPGCYRLWTRKRNLGSRLPTVQRLSINQFAQGLKELQPRVLRTGELYSSLPYTLGRVLSTWSQHGPSTSSSDCAALHTSCCLLQPIPSINIRSPDSLLGAAPLLLNTSPPRWNIHCLKEKPSLAIVPKTCQHQEDLSLPFSLSPPKALVHSFEQSEALPVPCVRVQNSSKDNVKEELGRKPQRVSQIRIRKTVPKPDPNLTPMGLPKAKRLNKKEFSLEDIYTNKNYKSPPVASLETIFEEPKEKDGILVSLSHQKRKRVLEFRDCTVPRVKRAKGKVKVAIGCKRGRKAAVEGLHLDALLIQKLMELENFLLEEEAVEKAQAAAERVS